jgi:hypothetical protein
LLTPDSCLLTPAAEAPYWLSTFVQPARSGALAVSVRRDDLLPLQEVVLVAPVPLEGWEGCPWSGRPRTWAQPSIRLAEGGLTLDARAVAIPPPLFDSPALSAQRRAARIESPAPAPIVLGGQTWAPVPGGPLPPDAGAGQPSGTVIVVPAPFTCPARALFWAGAVAAVLLREE